MGSAAIRRRGNNEYAYCVHYDQNQRIEEYCDLVSDAEARKRILCCEGSGLSTMPAMPAVSFDTVMQRWFGGPALDYILV